MQLAARGEQRLPQQLAIAGAISAVQEARKAIVATLHDVLRNAWQVESRLAGHVHSIAAAVATMRGHNAGDAVGIRRAGVSEVNLTLFPAGARGPGPVVGAVVAVLGDAAFELDVLDQAAPGFVVRWKVGKTLQGLVGW